MNNNVRAKTVIRKLPNFILPYSLPQSGQSRRAAVGAFFAFQALPIQMAAVTLVSCHSPPCFQEVHPAATSRNILLPGMKLTDKPVSTRT
jgi:hypothetical protein